MTECLNETMRDRLPELANGLLSAPEASAVRAHVAECGECASELALLETTRLVLRANAPRVDAAAIATALASRPALRVERGGAPAPSVKRPSVWRSRQMLAAAASILVVVSLTLPLLKGTGAEPGTGADTTVAVTGDSQAGSPARAGLAMSEGLSDLSADDLFTLLNEIDGVEATITAEPSTVHQPTVDTPEDN